MRPKFLRMLFGCTDREVKASAIMEATEREHAVATEKMDRKIEKAEEAATAAQSLLKRLGEDLP